MVRSVGGWMSEMILSVGGWMSEMVRSVGGWMSEMILSEAVCKQEVLHDVKHFLSEIILDCNILDQRTMVKGPDLLMATPLASTALSRNTYVPSGRTLPLASPDQRKLGAWVAYTLLPHLSNTEKLN